MDMLIQQNLVRSRQRAIIDNLNPTWLDESDKGLHRREIHCHITMTKHTHNDRAISLNHKRFSLENFPDMEIENRCLNIFS